MKWAEGEGIRSVCEDRDVLSFSCRFKSNLSFGIGNGHVASRYETLFILHVVEFFLPICLMNGKVDAI